MSSTTSSKTVRLVTSQATDLSPNGDTCSIPQFFESDRQLLDETAALKYLARVISVHLGVTPEAETGRAEGGDRSSGF